MIVDRLAESRAAILLASLPARRQLRRALANGLPPVLERSLRLLLGARPDARVREALRRVEAHRCSVLALAAGDDVAADGSLPAVPRAELFRGLAERSSVLPYWGAFLHALADDLRAGTVLELGTCVGVSAAYLGSAPSCRRLVTVERWSGLARVARNGLRDLAPAATVVTADFDEALDRCLPELAGRIDLAFLDGPKETLPVLHLFERIAPALAPGGMLVLDDVHWSPAMDAAWKAVRVASGFSWTIDAGRMGLCRKGSAGETPRTVDLWGSGLLDPYALKTWIVRRRASARGPLRAVPRPGDHVPRERR